MINAVPALVALLIKFVIFGYSRRTTRRSYETRVFIALLAVMSALNIVELLLFYSRAQGMEQPIGGPAYFAFAMVTNALILHLCWALSPVSGRHTGIVMAFIYIPTLILDIIVFSGPWIVQDWKVMSYTYTQVAGPLYFLFETHVNIFLVSSIGLLVWGATSRRHSTFRRRQSRLVLTGVLPIPLLAIFLVFMQRHGFTAFNATATMPIAFSFFLIVAALATHEHRLFDISFFWPGSKIRQRKTSFYRDMQNFVGELAQLDSARDILGRLSGLFSTPLALVTENNKPVAVAGSAHYMAEMPTEILSGIRDITVQSEIRETEPTIANLLERHDIAAVIPFFPHSYRYRGWLLIGPNFSELVYSRKDFQLIEEFFGTLAHQFMDSLIMAPTAISRARKELHRLTLREQGLEKSIVALEAENRELRKIADELKLLVALSLAPDPAADAKTPVFNPTLTHLGRNKAVLGKLRETYPQTEQYIGVQSKTFRAQPLPDLVVFEIPDIRNSAVTRFVDFVTARTRKTSLLCYGADVQAFRHEYADLFRGHLIDFAENEEEPDRLLFQANALLRLRDRLLDNTSPDLPLVTSPGSILARNIKRAAHSSESVLLVSADPAERRAWLGYLECAQSSVTIRVDDERFDIDTLKAQLGTSRGRITVVVEDLSSLSPQWMDVIPDLISEHSNFRLLAGSDSMLTLPAREQRSLLTISIPELAHRAVDAQLITQYLNLQINLSAPKLSYLSQADVRNLLQGNVKTIAELYNAVREALHQRETAGKSSLADSPVLTMSLDEYLASVEKKLLADTLDRCNGNKSKAARQLGLRANTLHYKLERYGLLVKKRRKQNSPA